MTCKITIPGRLPGLNDYIAAERTHRQKGAKVKRDAQDYVLRALTGNKRTFSAPVCMDYLWAEKDRRRDKDNVSSFGRKVIQDALVECGVLRGDGWAHIDGFSDSFKVDKRNPRIEVVIKEAAL